MIGVRIYVPGDASAVAVGADQVANAIEAAAERSGTAAEIVRNGSRGLHWLEPMVEVATGEGRVAYGPVAVADAEAVFEAAAANGGRHPLRLGDPEQIPFLKNQTRLTFVRCGIVDPRSLED